MNAAPIELRGIACTFVSKDAPGQRYTAVEDVNLTVAEGEFVSVVGPTGCGKSTLLNVAAGLLLPSKGSVLILDTEFSYPLKITINNKLATRERSTKAKTASTISLSLAAKMLGRACMSSCMKFIYNITIPNISPR